MQLLIEADWELRDMIKRKLINNRRIKAGEPPSDSPREATVAMMTTMTNLVMVAMTMNLMMTPVQVTVMMRTPAQETAINITNTTMMVIMMNPMTNPVQETAITMNPAQEMATNTTNTITRFYQRVMVTKT